MYYRDLPAHPTSHSVRRTDLCLELGNRGAQLCGGPKNGGLGRFLGYVSSTTRTHARTHTRTRRV